MACGDDSHGGLCGRKYDIRIIYGVMSHDKIKLPKFDQVPRVPVNSASRTLRTGQAQLSQPPWYPGDRRGSVLSGPQVRFILVSLRPLRPPGTLWTGGTHSSQSPGCPGDWWDSVISAPQLHSGPGDPKWTDAGESLTESRGRLVVPVL